jgi:antitoxin component YwqK of YwqJK toxin-antitoxin module
MAKQQKSAEVANCTVGGKKDGLWTTFYADGTKRSEGAYAAGAKHGKWMQYHKNGKPATEATFHEGKYVGRYRAFHDNGKLAMEGHYNPIRGNSADGTKDGEFTYYNTDGKTVWRIITYKRGSRTKPDDLPTARDY